MKIIVKVVDLCHIIVDDQEKILEEVEKLKSIKFKKSESKKKESSHQMNL